MPGSVVGRYMNYYSYKSAPSLSGRVRRARMDDRRPGALAVPTWIAPLFPGLERFLLRLRSRLGIGGHPHRHRILASTNTGPFPPPVSEPRIHRYGSRVTSSRNHVTSSRNRLTPSPNRTSPCRTPTARTRNRFARPRKSSSRSPRGTAFTILLGSRVEASKRRGRGRWRHDNDEQAGR